ncbi:MAG: S46 family peptidase [Ignavibacteria bacterium]|nr:S46 family peptidase [Ignavibacteria bacterium]
MMKRIHLIALFVAFLFAQTTTVFAQANSGSWIKLDTVKAGRFDNGKMWTFDFPPKKYFETEYNFIPKDDWFENVRMAALRFATYCSASFVSEDGLVMTNHHCARESVTEVQKPGENFHDFGFWAPTLQDERKVPGLFVDQLVLIKDVTADIQSAIDKGKDDAEKVKNYEDKKKEVEKNYKTETGLECSVVRFYNGGKYSLYGYKRYNDVRLVFAPEVQLGFYGGDPDNFTYPRYALDCSFFRVYDENGKPLKTKHFYKWSPKGAADGEPVFVVGNPGRTGRLRTIAQLEYARDIQNPVTYRMLKGLCDVYSEYIAQDNPPNKDELNDHYFSYSNSLKVYDGILKGLRDEVLMQKKRVFENNFKAAVNANPKLQAVYGDMWSKIEGTRAEVRKIAVQSASYNLSPIVLAQYFTVAKQLIKYAEQLKKPEVEREKDYVADSLTKTAEKIFPADFAKGMQDRLLALDLNFVYSCVGDQHEMIQLAGGKIGKEGAQYLLKNSLITSKSDVIKLAAKGADAILNSSDPFIKYMLQTKTKAKELSDKVRTIVNSETDYVQKLGRALFEVYGTEIPPDATFSLRISDGVVKGYDYNGTTAPSHTTFYGLYDRCYSNENKFPWNLPERWLHPSKDFDMETPMVFVSTNDIIGGNSGSPVINKNAEVVGLAFDGNIESLPGEFIFTTEANRTLSVHSTGMLEAIQDMYLAKRLSEELKAGKIK